MIWPEDDRIRKTFAATARRYDDHARRRFRRIAGAVIDVAGVVRSDLVLDVACGSGLVARVMRERGLREPVGLDISLPLLALAPLRWRVVGDAQSLPFTDRSFDAVVCSLGIQMFPDPRPGLKEMFRVLKSPGKVGLSIWGDPGSAAPLDEAALRVLNEMLEASGGNESRWQVEQEVIEGPEELVKQLEEAGFSQCRFEVRRKRSGFRDAAHYFEMLSIFPSAWARLDALGHLADSAEMQAVAAVEKAVGHKGPFEVYEETIVAGGIKQDG